MFNVNGTCTTVNESITRSFSVAPSIASRMKVCVIGAGVAGLAAIKRIAQVPGFEGTVYEQSGDIGGVWSDFKNQEQCYDTPMYHNLRTNFPREVTQYMDLEFKQGEASYVYRHDVHNYLKEYSKEFNLKQFIQVRKKVTCIKPKLDNCGSVGPQWQVDITDLKNGDHQTAVFDSVMVCSGHFYKPSIPHVANLEAFKGQVLHSLYYKSAEQFTGKNVVIVGAGPSAGDISMEISKFASKVIRSFRQVPKDVAPVAENVVHVGAIESVNSDGFVFENGQDFEADCLMFATGYLYDFPFLHETCEVTVADGKLVKPLFKHMIHPKYPTLCFIAIPFTILPFYISDIQSRFYMAFLTGKIKLPNQEEMELDQTLDLNSRSSEGVPLRHAHELASRQWAYYDELAQLGGFQDDLKPVLKEIFNHVVRRMKESRVDYRDDTYRLIDKHSFIMESQSN